jgi:hypothetical protein
MSTMSEDKDEGALELTISDGKQSQILHSTDHLKERLEDIKQKREDTDDDEPEICECCGQIIK